MNYKQIGLIIVSICFTSLMIGCLTLKVDIIYYSVVGLIVLGFAILAIYAHTDLNYDQKLKIEELNAKLDSLKNQLNKRSAV